MAVATRREQPSELAVVRFLRETIDELRKVSWPSASELYRYTLVVLVTVIVIAAFIASVDYGLTQFSRHVIYGVA